MRLKILKWLLLIALGFFLLVVAAGIYRFNFTDDDIYVQMPDGSVLPWAQYEQQEKQISHD